MKGEGAVLGEAGLRPTRQRLAILHAVAGERRPVTAQELYSRLRVRRRSPGLATIYRTLRSLSEAGVLRTFPAGEAGHAAPGRHLRPVRGLPENMARPRVPTRRETFDVGRS